MEKNYIIIKFRQAKRIMVYSTVHYTAGCMLSFYVVVQTDTHTLRIGEEGVHEITLNP